MSSPAAADRKPCRRLQFCDSRTFTISSRQPSKLDQLQGGTDQEKTAQSVDGPLNKCRQPAIVAERLAGRAPVLGEAHEPAEQARCMQELPSAVPPRSGQYAENSVVPDCAGVTGTSSSSPSTEMSSSTSTLSTLSSEWTSTFESSSGPTTKKKSQTILQCHVSTEVGDSLDPIIETTLPTIESVAPQEESQGEPPPNWMPVVGAVVLSAILVALTVTAADRVNRIMMASLVTEPLQETPHLAFPIEDIGAGLVVTDPVQIIGKEGEPIGSDGFDINADDVDHRTGTGTHNMSRTSARKLSRSGGAYTTSATFPVGPAIADDVSDNDGAGTETLNDIMAFPYRLPAQRSCSGAFYTTCPKTRREYRYSRSVSACVEAGARDPTALFHVCNRSPNRFSSAQVCEKRCVLSERPDDGCLEKPFFTACGRQDLKIAWWFFDGRICHRWNFPKGGCPANEGAVAIFSSEAECSWRCTNPRYPPCRRPASAPCGTQFLKFPAFAHVSKDDGRIRCLTTRASQPWVSRCLAGSNRYHSKRACQKSCVRNARSNTTTPENRIRRRKDS
ncbi:hypothetical protein MTO96_016266 [Rhipicephalus appendiculatus]